MMKNLSFLCAFLFSTAFAPLSAHPEEEENSTHPKWDARLGNLEEMAWYRTSRGEDNRDYPWWRGNLHTHTLWSDGDNYPEPVVEWYKQHGYHFLALSDHNILSEGQKWIHPEKRRHTRGRGKETFRKYVDQFGAWVETRVVDEAFHRWLHNRTGRWLRPDDGEIEVGDTVVRLKPLNEFRHLFEEPGKFLLVQSEEITDGAVHINATNVIELIEPQGGETVVDKIRNNIDAVLEQRERTGQAMLPHLNHPNFRWAVTAEEMARVKRLRFFEVYNGHPTVRNYGDDQRPGTERMWDIVLTRRLGKGLGPVYGLAVDDAHQHTTPRRAGTSSPGKGWIMARAPFLTPEHLIHALEAGDFYASTGVSLNDIRFDGETLAIEIAGNPGATYRTQFIGTRIGYDPATVAVKDEEGNTIATQYSADVGEVLFETEGTTPSYRLRGDELYIRATIISSEPHPAPFIEGDPQMAWVQPVVRP